MAARKKASKKKSVKKSAPSAKRKASPTVAKRGVKRAVKKKSAVVKKAGPVSVGRKPYSKSQFVTAISEHTGVSRKEVSAILEAVSGIIHAHLQKSGPELFSWPGLMKIKVVKKPATKARQGINPFTGESMMFKAKPASRRVKVLPLKKLKEMAQ